MKERLMQRSRLTLAAVAVAVAGAFAAGYNHDRLTTFTAAHAAPAAGAPATTPGPVAGTRLPDFSQLVDQAGPAVVFINVTKRSGEAPAADDSADDQPGEANPLEEFLRRFGVPGPQGRGGPMIPRGMPGPQQPLMGVGSGFIISPDGVILTNAHVVDGATEVNVRLPDRREFRGKVLGSDRRTDVAVVKIDAKNLPTVRLGKADNVRVGEWVAAIGAPFGLDNTVTAGIVSAKSRSLPSDSLVPFIQTDVAVNPGNSGGPLFNMQGEVVGINSQIYSRTGGYMGLSFAIPIDVALQVKDQLVTTGKVTRGRIGVGIQPVTQPLAESFGLKKAEGALVSQVEPNGPAAQAGLKTGDVILSWNGKPVDTANGLPLLVANTKPGETATAEVWRDGAKRDVKVTVAEMPADKTAVASAAAKAERGKLGVAVRPLEPNEAQRLGTEGGLVVEESGGPAARAGIRAGDVIIGVNGKPVKSTAELKQAIEGAGKNAAVLVQRGEARIFVPVEMG